ncbi:hypothetical protein Tco_1310223 [Tanacetum coccineum]
MSERYSGDSWTIEGWFKSGVNSIGVSQTSTMQKDQTRTTTVTWCQKDQTRTTTTCGVRSTRLANIEEVHVQLFPRCYKATTTILLSPSEAQLWDEGATTASEGVKAEPHSYFQLRSEGATSEGVEANQTILMFEAHFLSLSGPRKFASTPSLLHTLHFQFHSELQISFTHMIGVSLCSFSYEAISIYQTSTIYL